MDKYYNEEIMPEKRYSIISKIIFIVLIVIIIFSIFGNRKPVDTKYGGYDIMQDPVQKKISSKDTITQKIDDEYECIMYPQASYKMTVKIKSINTLNFMDPEWRIKLSKYDLGVVWGSLSDKYYDQFITYSQVNRYLSWYYSNEIGLSGTYISTHISNNHTIPANENILRGISNLKVDDICYIEGKLVNYDINQNNKKIGSMESSLVRTDTGNGACETFYIEKLILGDVTYQ
jgi:hypothetical protein